MDLPEIRIAPKHKEINPDKIPKRPEEKLTYENMNDDEMLAFLISHQNMKIDMMKYYSNYNGMKEKINTIDKSALRILIRLFLKHLVKHHGYGEKLMG